MAQQAAVSPTLQLSFLQPLQECGVGDSQAQTLRGVGHADAPHPLTQLPPRRHRAADASSDHSITSSARASNTHQSPPHSSNVGSRCCPLTATGSGYQPDHCQGARAHGATGSRHHFERVRRSLPASARCGCSALWSQRVISHPKARAGNRRRRGICPAWDLRRHLQTRRAAAECS